MAQVGSLARELNKAQAQNKFLKLYNALKWLPMDIEMNIMANRAAKDPEYFKELERETFGDPDPVVNDGQQSVVEEPTMSVKETEKAAQKLHDEYEDGKVAPIIVRDAEKYDDILTQQRIIERGINTQKLINYAYFYMQNKEAALIKRPQVEKEIINGIAAIFGFPKIYESAGIASLKQYDMQYPDEFLETSKFILSVAEIRRKANDPCFMAKVKERMDLYNAEHACPQDDPAEPDDGTVMIVKGEEIKTVSKEEYQEQKEEEKKKDPNAPFWKISPEDQVLTKPVYIHQDDFDYEASVNDLPIQGHGITDELLEELEKTVGAMCKEKHRYERASDCSLVTMFVNRGKGVEDQYLIDPAIVMGCGYYGIMVMAPTQNTVFVPAIPEFEDIVKDIFLNPKYVLSEDQYQLIMQKYFRNFKIYKYLDMSYTEALAELKPEEFQKMGKKLTFILNQVSKQMAGTELPRFRINFYDSIDDFMIISDPSVISPMMYDGSTSPVLCEGLIYDVKGDTVTQYYMGQQVEFHIDKYGAM